MIQIAQNDKSPFEDLCRVFQGSTSWSEELTVFLLKLARQLCSGRAVLYREIGDRSETVASAEVTRIEDYQCCTQSSLVWENESERVFLAVSRAQYSYTQGELESLSQAALVLGLNQRLRFSREASAALSRSLECAEGALKKCEASRDRWERKYRCLSEYSEGLTRILFRSSRSLEQQLGKMSRLTAPELEGIEELRGLIRDHALVTKSLLAKSTLRAKGPEIQKVNLNFALFEALEKISPAWEEKRYLFSRPRLPVVEGDPEQWKALFSELLCNCVDHGRSGMEIVLSMEEGVDEYHFRLADSGPGVPPEWREKVFRPFAKVPTPQSSEHLGLGLFHCRSLIEIFGGRIWLASRASGTGVVCHWVVPKRANSS